MSGGSGALAIAQAVLCFALGAGCAHSQTSQPGSLPGAASDPVVDRIVASHPLSAKRATGCDGESQLFPGLLAEWRSTGDGRLFEIVKSDVDAAIGGDCPASDAASFAAAMQTARAEVEVYRVTLDPRYYHAAAGLRAKPPAKNPLAACATSAEKAPEDGRPMCVYATLTFLADFGRTFHRPEDVSLAVEQLTETAMAEQKMRAGQLHPAAWESATAADILELLNHAGTDSEAVEKVLRGLLGPGAASAAPDAPDFMTSALLLYARDKGQRLGVLPLHRASFRLEAMQRRLLALTAPPPPETTAAYLMALSEETQRQRAGSLLAKARGGVVIFDGWFNSQQRKNADGFEEPFHYKPDDDAASGYSIFARMFQQYGLRTEVLEHAPRPADLAPAKIYIITSPDIPAVNPATHFMDGESADAIEAWVKAGGVLLLMQNDKKRSEFEKFDMLADRFGMHFNAVLRNAEPSRIYDNTLVRIPAGAAGIFSNAHTGLMKETSTITVRPPAHIVLTDAGCKEARGDILTAVASAGKGLVFGNVDPWVYNEYTDGRKLPLGEDNYAAGLELTHWLVEAITKRQSRGEP